MPTFKVLDGEGKEIFSVVGGGQGNVNKVFDFVLHRK